MFFVCFFDFYYQYKASNDLLEPESTTWLIMIAQTDGYVNI